MMDSRRTKRPERSGPLRRLGSIGSRLLANRAFLRVFSVFAAVAVWCFMVASDGTLTRHKTFLAAPVTVSGESALLTRGFIVTDDLTKILPTVDMTVEVAQNNYDRVTASSYNPHIELTQISGEGEFELPIIPTSQVYGQVISCVPSSVTVHAERYVTRRVPVVVTQEGNLADGLYLASAEADPATLVVSGPQSVVSRVMRAAVKLDRASLSAERMSDRMALDFILQDATGLEVVSDKLNVTNQSVVTRSVMVDVSMVPMKRVPVDVSGLVAGEPAEGYEVIDTWATEETLEVAAESEVLDAISVIGVDAPLDVTGADATVNGYVRLKTLSSVVNRLPAQLGVTAVIEEQETQRTFRNVPILIEGLTDDLSASLSQSKTTVQVTGGYSFIRGLTQDDIQLYVDVAGLSVGRHTLAVQIRIDNAQPFTCALGAPEVTLQLRTR